VVQIFLSYLSKFIKRLYASGRDFLRNRFEAFESWLYLFFSGEKYEPEVIRVKSDHYYKPSDVITWEIDSSQQFQYEVTDEDDDKPYILIYFKAILRRIHRWIVLHFEIDDLLLEAKHIDFAAPSFTPKSYDYEKKPSLTVTFNYFLRKYYELISRYFLWRKGRSPYPAVKSTIYKPKLYSSPGMESIQSIQIRGPAFRRILYFAPLFEKDGSCSNRSQRTCWIKPVQRTDKGRTQGKSSYL
jgi:hypothetical protein